MSHRKLIHTDKTEVDCCFDSIKQTSQEIMSERISGKFSMEKPLQRETTWGGYYERWHVAHPEYYHVPHGCNHCMIW